MTHSSVEYPVHAEVLDKHLADRLEDNLVLCLLLCVTICDDEQRSEAADSTDGFSGLLDIALKVCDLDVLVSYKRLQIVHGKLRYSKAGDGSAIVDDDVFGDLDVFRGEADTRKSSSSLELWLFTRLLGEQVFQLQRDCGGSVM